jgi:hypothetical protein
MKVIGLYTEDFRFFYEVVRLLKEKGEPFVSLGREGSVPPTVGVVITTEAERESVNFGNVVAERDPEEAMNTARCLLMGGIRYRTIVVGIDPGKNVGVAIFGEGKLLATETVKAPETVPEALSKLLRCLTYSRSIARVGDGDPTKGSRIIRAIWDQFDEVEVVDETGTTVRSEQPDVEAAKRIAMSKGVRMEQPPPVMPTPGEVRDIQRLSRIESQGSVTISSDLAHSVAKGERTLAEAIGEQRRSERRVRPGSG